MTQVSPLRYRNSYIRITRNKGPFQRRTFCIGKWPKVQKTVPKVQKLFRLENEKYYRSYVRGVFECKILVFISIKSGLNLKRI